MTKTDSTPSLKSINQNQHGVDLRNVEPGTSWPVVINGDRSTATVLDRNLTHDEFTIRINSPYETEAQEVTGAAFHPPVEHVRNAISDTEFNKLEEGDQIGFYAVGHEHSTLGWVDDINEEDEEVFVCGECNAQTLARWVPRELIQEVRKHDE